MAGVVLPALEFKPTNAKSSRHGARVRLVTVHRWGTRNLDAPDAAEMLSYGGVIKEFEDPKNQASAHFVGPVKGKAGWEMTQMVRYADKAWTESFFNPVCVEVESPDNLWVGTVRPEDREGLHELARVVAYLLHRYNLPPVQLTAHQAVNNGRGFCRHADLGSPGGGHTQCPTTDMALWHLFGSMVKYEAARGGFRPVYGV